MIKTLLTLAKSKTVWGSFILAAAYIPKFAPYADWIRAVGTGLAGVGMAHKLDKIKAVLDEPDDTSPAQS